MKATIVVTGGTGFIGSAVVHDLLGSGEPARVFGRDEAKIRKRFDSHPVEARTGDARAVESLRAAFEGADTVIDCIQFPNSPIENKRKGWTFEQVDFEGTVTRW